MRLDIEKNLELRPVEIEMRKGHFVSQEEALTMRKCIYACIEGLLAKTTPIRVPSPQKDWCFRGEGSFHLAPELFIQTIGSTLFTFPHEQLVLTAGEVLIVPARVLHAERVLHTAPWEQFSNVVVYADDASLICHLAHEMEPGIPDIYYLEACHHNHATRIHDWLAEATQQAWDADNKWNELPHKEFFLGKEWMLDVHTRALIAAACVGVLKVLNDAARKGAPEPTLIAHVRAWIHNRIGDHCLSVSSLASQAGCTVAYLSHLFSQTTGEHLVTYINRERMRRAARLLAETDMAGKEVAWACGFTTPSYFVQTFRAFYGVTPKKWREKRKGDSSPI